MEQELIYFGIIENKEGLKVGYSRPLPHTSMQNLTITFLSDDPLVKPSSQIQIKRIDRKNR